MNPYLDLLKANLPRLFSLYNLDPVSSTYGYGDRLYWGWKMSDYANGTFQGGVHAVAIALRLNLIESREFGLAIIDCAVNAIRKIRAKNGSLVEAYPNEHSFCVTALVAFDVLSAVRCLGSDISPGQKGEYLNAIKPLILFITRNSEKHATISNHLATAVAAIELWNLLSGEESNRGKELLSIIYRNQSQEGWYREYEGPDPAYQTLCTYYLFCAYEVTEDKELLESLRRSVVFLKYFVHPDGTIGGLYGSRNTEVYYPGGMVGLAPTSEEFALVATHLHKSVLRGNHVFPQDIDNGNFVPLINAYAVAALHYEKAGLGIRETEYSAPCDETFARKFEMAGVYVHSTKRYYAIVNYVKGGTLKVFDKTTGMLDMEDGGIFGRLANGKRFSTQMLDRKQDFNDCSIHAGFCLTTEAYPNPATYLLLRILALSFFRSIYVGELFKEYIVKRLITKRTWIDGKVTRRFEFNEERVVVHEEIIRPKMCADYMGHRGKCRAVHMASSGYYLTQDQQKRPKSTLVTFKHVESAKGHKGSTS